MDIKVPHIIHPLPDIQCRILPQGLLRAHYTCLLRKEQRRQESSPSLVVECSLRSPPLTALHLFTRLTQVQRWANPRMFTSPQVDPSIPRLVGQGLSILPVSILLVFIRYMVQVWGRLVLPDHLLIWSLLIYRSRTPQAQGRLHFQGRVCTQYILSAQALCQVVDRSTSQVLALHQFITQARQFQRPNRRLFQVAVRRQSPTQHPVLALDTPQDRALQKDIPQAGTRLQT